MVIDDTMKADMAYRLACEGTALLWRGDFQNAKQLLQAMSRRMDNKKHPNKKKPASKNEGANSDTTPANPMTQVFHQFRMAQAQRARTLGMLLIPVHAGFEIPLRRAPDIKAACTYAYGQCDTNMVVSLRELLGVVGSHEWRKKGVAVPFLNANIHPHYGVFSPVRGEYIELVAQAPLPSITPAFTAFDIGTGTGVLAAVLAKRGIHHIVATDNAPRALACASENIRALGYQPQVSILQTDLFPDGQANLIVCNPPWLPGRPATPMEHAIYDADSQMLKGFLSQLKSHLTPTGEGWLILSDLAEHLGLRSRETLIDWIAEAGLQVVDKLDTKPKHPKANDQDDPLHAARSKEITSLWRLGVV